MIGTLPRTSWLLLHYNMKVGLFNSLYEVGLHVGFKMQDDGYVYLESSQFGPGYLIEGMQIEVPAITPWENKYEAFKDWCKHHMKLPSGYSLYRVMH